MLLLNEKAYEMGTFSRAALSTENVDYNVRLWMALSATSFIGVICVTAAKWPVTDAYNR